MKTDAQTVQTTPLCYDGCARCDDNETSLAGSAVILSGVLRFLCHP